MTTSSDSAGTTIPFDRFWRWLHQHSNCILRAGSPDLWLYDHDEFHWHLDEDGEHNPVVQLVWGKRMVGEMVLNAQDLLFVEVLPDPEASDQPQVLFEVVGGADDPQPIFHFLLAHGFDDPTPHGAVKH